jgi:hypothetical protein
MNETLVRTLVVTLAAVFASAAVAGDKQPLPPEVSLCQRDILSQINLEHQHAKVDFNDKATTVSAPAGNEVNVNGKGNFTKKDGTVKKFDYTCRINTAENRVVSATFTKTGEK